MVRVFSSPRRTKRRTEGMEGKKEKKKRREERRANKGKDEKTKRCGRRWFLTVFDGANRTIKLGRIHLVLRERWSMPLGISLAIFVTSGTHTHPDKSDELPLGRLLSLSLIPSRHPYPRICFADTVPNVRNGGSLPSFLKV